MQALRRKEGRGVKTEEKKPPETTKNRPSGKGPLSLTAAAFPHFPFDFPPRSGYILLFKAKSFAEPEEWLSG